MRPTWSLKASLCLTLAGSLVFFASGCRRPSPQSEHTLRLALDRPPSQLHPFLALDTSAQKITPLWTRGLTLLDADGNPIPGLATSWSASKDFKTWSFRLDPKAQDHTGNPIHAQDWLECLENYRRLHPLPVTSAGLDDWSETAVGAAKKNLQIKFKNPQPDAALKLAGLPFFRVKNPSQPGHTTACTPSQDPTQWIGTGDFQLQAEGSDFKTFSKLRFLRHGSPSPLTLDLVFIRQELTRAWMLLRGNTDGVYSSLSLAKTHWLQQNPNYLLLQGPSRSVDFVFYNTEHAPLNRPEVRKLLGQALPQQEILAHKYFGFGKSEPIATAAPDWTAINRRFDALGFGRQGPDGTRFRLRYRTTPVREGIEKALVFRNYWRKIGVELDLQVVEPGIFFKTVQQGHFDVLSTRILHPISQGALWQTFRTQDIRNYSRYRSQEFDGLVQKWFVTDPATRPKIASQIQAILEADHPASPLWTIDQVLILHKSKAQLIPGAQTSLSGRLDTLFLSPEPTAHN